MKVKYTLFPFVPFALAMIALKICEIFAVDSNGLLFGLTVTTVDYIVIGAAIALFVVCIIMNLFDKKTAPVYEVAKNPISGVLSVLSGIVTVGASVYAAVMCDTAQDYYIMSIVCALLSIPAAIAFFVMSKVHFAGKSPVSNISMLFIFPALWGCSELVYQFLRATKVSISASDMTPLFCFIFVTLYFFSHAMAVSKIKGRNPVKACFIYGLPMIAISLSYGAYSVLKPLTEGLNEYQTISNGAMFLILALYSLSFVIEVFVRSLTNDEVEIIDGMPIEDNAQEAQEKAKDDYTDNNADYEDLVFSERGEDDVDESGNSDYVTSYEGLNDFVMGYSDEDDEEPIPYLTKNEINNANDYNDLLISSGEDDNLVKVNKQKKHGNKQHIFFTDSQPSIVQDIKAPMNKTKEQKVEKEQNAQEQQISEVDKLLQDLENKK